MSEFRVSLQRRRKANLHIPHIFNFASIILDQRSHKLLKKDRSGCHTDHCRCHHSRKRCHYHNFWFSVIEVSKSNGNAFLSKIDPLGPQRSQRPISVLVCVTPVRVHHEITWVFWQFSEETKNGHLLFLCLVLPVWFLLSLYASNMWWLPNISNAFFSFRTFFMQCL